MTVLWIICGVLLFLFLLTLIPLRIDTAFQQEFSLTLRYLFFRFPLLPGKDEVEGVKEETEEEAEKPEKKLDIKKILKRQGLSGFLKSLFELVQLAASASKRLISHVKLKNFDLYLCLAGAEDAAAAAIQYGQVSAGVYSACGILFGLMDCKRKAATVDLNYQLEESIVDFSARISILPLFLLREAFSLLIHGFPIVRRLLGADKRTKHQTERVSQMRKGEQQ